MWNNQRLHWRRERLPTPIFWPGEFQESHRQNTWVCLWGKVLITFLLPLNISGHVIKKIIVFSWRIIALQYCVVFCHTTWISHKCTYVPSSWTSSLPLLLPTPLACHSMLCWAPCVIQQLPIIYYFTYGNVYISVLLSQFLPPSPAPCYVHKSVLYVWVSVPALQ